MRYKLSLIVMGLILVVLAGMYIGHETVEISEIENRNMTTFEMVWNPIDDKDSVIYNADQSISDRMESAMKDQNPLRDKIMGYYWTIEYRMAELYDKTVNLFAREQEEPDFTDETDETDVTPETTEQTVTQTDPPVTETGDKPDETEAEISDTETVASPETTKESETTKAPETTKTPETEAPVVLDYSKYPGYGYARLTQLPKQNYTLSRLGQYYRINNTEWLVDLPWTSLGNANNMKGSIAAIERIKKNYPDMKVYGFFMTQGNNLPWFEKYMGKSFGDRHEQLAQLAPEWLKLDRLYYADIKDYQNLHYKSDHHWDYLGSRRGYERLYEMMSEDMELSPLQQPIMTWNFSELYDVEYRGSKANKLQLLYKGWDEFVVYEYDYGERYTYVLSPNDLTKQIPSRFALWEEYKAGKINKDKYYDHYINFNGIATDEKGMQYKDSEYIFVIENKNSNTGHNLLMFGDSNMRALRDVMATHYDTTVYLDYRIMAIPYIDELIDMYDIDVMMSVVQNGTFWFSGNKGQNSFTFSYKMK